MKPNENYGRKVGLQAINFGRSYIHHLNQKKQQKPKIHAEKKCDPPLCDAWFFIKIVCIRVKTKKQNPVFSPHVCARASRVRV